MFNGAAAFDQNLASWNVLRVTSLAVNFDSASALSSCNKGAIYLAWGTTLRTAYPTWSSMCGASFSLTCQTKAHAHAHDRHPIHGARRTRTHRHPIMGPHA
jgi:hypothetical protein